MVGWIDMNAHAPELLPIDRLGRPLETVSEWPEAEQALEDRGLQFLANRFTYLGRSVRIRTLDHHRIVLTTAQSDAVGDIGEEVVLPFPAGEDLIEYDGR